MLRNRTTSRNSVWFLASLGLALAAAACDSGRAGDSTPTGPRLPAPPPPEAATWSGEWFLEGSTPVDNCMSEALNAVAAQGFRMTLKVALEIDRGNIDVRLLYDLGNRSEEGFWPLEFHGTIDEEGLVRASVPASYLGAPRSDPWLEFCSPNWLIEGGELAAVLSADGRTLTGTTTETYRALAPAPEVEFTVHGRLVAVAR